MQYRIVTRIIICDASGEKICITMPYYVLWITSSHEACTVCNPCSHGRKSVSFPSQCAFAYHKFTKKEFDIVYDSNEIR
ncbi:hypothetical protein T12_15779 [Trichinella patagoniensis]|uniref:Uncharacterized protein n=1 Tax=Trichinella patagoniensis TaxID=990121 RepID=A0A0V0Z8G6_9BILA|nr:hypothetical protein T12_15779 [Trichinella patagoniensis]